MWRRSQRCWMTFERLLCGPAGRPPPTAQEAREAVKRLHTLCPAAPLPRPLAASLVRSCMQHAQYAEMLQLLTCQPQGDAKSEDEGESGVKAILALVSRELRHTLASSSASTSSALEMLDMLERSLRVVQEAGLQEATVPLLQMMAECAACTRSTDKANSNNTSEPTEDEDTCESTKDANGVPDARREALRAAMVHYVRFEPRSAAGLLRALCLVSDAAHVTRPCCEDALEVLQVVIRNASRPLDGKEGGAGATNAARAVLMLADEEESTEENSIDGYSITSRVRRTSAMEELLSLLLARGTAPDKQAGVYLRKMVQLWNTQLQHSSARWHTGVVSLIIRAYVGLQRVNEAMECVQILAEAEQKRPSLAAQAALLRGVRTQPVYGRTPLVQYVDQLIAYWYSPAKTHSTDDTRTGKGATPTLCEALWCTEARTVGAELLLLHFHHFRQDRVRALLREASHALCNKRAEAEAFLRNEPLAALLHYFAAFIMGQRENNNKNNNSNTNNDYYDAEQLRQVFFETPLAMADLARRPQLFAAVLEMGRKAEQLPRVYAVCATMHMSDSDFAQLVRLVTSEASGVRGGSDSSNKGGRSGWTEGRAPEARLAMVRDVAQHLHKEVPEDVRVWLDLLQR